MPPANLDWLTYKVSFGFGGLNGSPNLDVVPPEAFIPFSKNLNNHAGGREKRGGTTIAGTVTGASKVLRIFQFRKIDGTVQTITHDVSGTVYKDYSTSVRTGRAVTGYSDFLYYRDTGYFVDGANAPPTNESDTPWRFG